MKKVTLDDQGASSLTDACISDIVSRMHVPVKTSISQSQSGGLPRVDVTGLAQRAMLVAGGLILMNTIERRSDEYIVAALEQWMDLRERLDLAAPNSVDVVWSMIEERDAPTIVHNPWSFRI